MDFYYNKSMGNGTVTSKFRLNPIATSSSTSVQSNQSNLRSEIIPKETTTTSTNKQPSQETVSQGSIEPEDELKISFVNKESVQESSTHHSSNCNRCYRLKKKCSREYPKCSNCVRTSSECEYVNRTTKRRKRKLADVKSEESTTVASTGVSEIKSRKLVSVSSLLSTESDINSSDSEFITMKSIDVELPMTFVLNYFENYNYRYPFINKERFLQDFSKFEFSNQTIINLDMYLLMSIGCLIYDSKNNTSYYQEYFQEKSIESLINIVDTTNFSIDNLKLLLLLTIHGITCINQDLCWNLIGVLDRAIIKWNMHTSQDIIQQRIVWTIHNLDKDISLLLKKPSQFPNYEYITKLEPVKLDQDEILPLINLNIELCKLQQSILHLNLTHTRTNLHELSSDLEKWRIDSSKVVHQSRDISDLIAWINLQYYYLLIELDQISLSQSFQFTLQFLSNSFTLLISDRQKKNVEKISLVTNLFWFIQLFNVIKFNIKSLKQLIESQDCQTRLEEFNSNLLLILNLLKYINVNFKPSHINSLIEVNITNLSELSLELIKFNNNQTNKTRLLEVIEKIEK
ncbi:hypothetical protein JA1_000368 [Spathaspora sp. JA1]|nr:hypothetical protein JA1_000368 [Spathaspora sp. JA1]